MIAEKVGNSVIACSRRFPLSAREISAFRPIGVIHATSLGMKTSDPLPFPDILETILPSLKWAVEWVNSRETAFSVWATNAGLRLVSGAELFERQAVLQSRIFIGGCGG
jgi:shikimate 5-dehydrogenase